MVQTYVKGDKMAENFDDLILEQNSKNERVKKILLRIIALVILFLAVLIVIKLVRGDERAGQSIMQGEPISADIPVNEGFDNDKFTELERQMQGEANGSAGGSALNAGGGAASSGGVLSGLENSGEINISKILETPLPAPIETPSNANSAGGSALNANSATSTAANSRGSVNSAGGSKPATSTSSGGKTAAGKGSNASAKTSSGTRNASKTAKPKTPIAPVILKATSEVGAGTYIQVFAVRKLDTNSHEIKKLEKGGYTYKTMPSNKLTKVLIGPFDRDEIAAELKKVRDTINADAFRITVSE